jgi:2,5-diamino-6-(ribosylamino)-4(3H)-pyrimidinone 5'-phosphate reductase
MKQPHPLNTLFLMISVDGKISTGGSDERDTDKDYKVIPGIKEGVHQYYDLERLTDRYSLNTGRTMAKIGVNTAKNPIHCPDVTFIIIDNNHLTAQGVQNLCANLEALILVTHNMKHPAFQEKLDNLFIIYYENEIDFVDLFAKLKKDFKIERITIQSGGTMNSILLRNNLIDKLSVVVVPCLIGGKQTATLVDGSSLFSEEDLKLIKVLKLEKAEVLKDSFLHLTYDVENN